MPILLQLRVAGFIGNSDPYNTPKLYDYLRKGKINTYNHHKTMMVSIIPKTARRQVIVQNPTSLPFQTQINMNNKTARITKPIYITCKP